MSVQHAVFSVDAKHTVVDREMGTSCCDLCLTHACAACLNDSASFKCRCIEMFVVEFKVEVDLLLLYVQSMFLIVFSVACACLCLLTYLLLYLYCPHQSRTCAIDHVTIL